MNDRNGAPADFVLLGHPDSYDHMGEMFVHANPDFNPDKLKKYKAAYVKFLEWAPSYVLKTPLDFEHDGQRLTGRMVICTFLPEMINSTGTMFKAYKKIRSGCHLASDLGAKVVGLGGFTSIIGGTQGEALAEAHNMAITSGNSFTAALALAQLEALLQRLGWSLSRQAVAVLGASGDIGRACTLALAPRARRTVLIARNRKKLNALRDELPPERDVRVSTQVEHALNANILITATSSADPLLNEAALCPGTIVCDISYPKNLSYSKRPRADVLTFSAGLAQLPFDLGIGHYTKLPGTLMYGCFSEAILLALSGKYENYSIGQRQITLEKMDRILKLAHHHGFRPAPWYRGQQPITEAQLDAFLSHACSGQ